MRRSLRSFGATLALAGWAWTAFAGGTPQVRPEFNRIYFSKVAGKVAENRKNPESIALALAAHIANAQRTLDVCCHEIDNKVVIEAIAEAHRRGVKVRVITETDYLKEAGPVALKELGIPIVSDNRSALMHNKFLVVDGMAVWTGSFNFTENCAYKNNNNGLYIANAQVAENYATWFQWFWDHGKNGRRGGTRRTPHPSVKLPAGTVIETRFTSFDKLDEAVIAAIRRARRTIDFAAFSYTHPGIAAAMVERAKAGVTVRGVFETRNAANSMLHRLQAAGIDVHEDGNPFALHHKFIVIDGEVFITGSFNFSSAAAHDNDENLVIVHSQLGAAKFAEEFQRVWRQAKGS